MNHNLNFFNPPTISVVLCLHNLVLKATQQRHPHPDPSSFTSRNKALNFLIDKIMELSVSSGATSMHSFQQDIINTCQDTELVSSLREIVSSMTDLNIFYRTVYKAIVELKEFKTNRNDSGSIIDLFLRRLAMYFQKFTFDEMEKLYTRFTEFVSGELKDEYLNEFTVGAKIEEIRFNVENYSIDLDHEEVAKTLNKLQKLDKDSRGLLLRGMNEILTKEDSRGIDNIYKYFDKEFEGLMHQRVEGGGQLNSINQCIIGSVYANLKMGFIDQALKGISEGLRISQNNSDEESINYCIMYLYQISAQLGKIKEEIVLTEHAITHSANLNNILLMIVSCLNYSLLERNYDCVGKDGSFLTGKKIKWTDALHFAKKKLYSNFQNSCKGMYHVERSLIIPLYLHKLAILNHVPQLKNLYLQGVYNTQAVKELDYTKLYLGKSKVEQMIENARLCFYRGEGHTFEEIFGGLERKTARAHMPRDSIHFRNFRCEILTAKGLLLEAIESIENLLFFCKERGFAKGEYIRCLLTLVKAYNQKQRYYDSLAVLEQIKIDCDAKNIQLESVEALILKAQTLLMLQNYAGAMTLLEAVEEGNLLYENCSLSSKFYLLKSEILLQLYRMLDQKEDGREILRNVEVLEEKSLGFLLEEMNLSKVKEVIERRLQRNHALKLNSPSSSHLQKALQYLKKSFEYFQNLRVDYQFDQNACRKISQLICNKVRGLVIS